MNAEERADQYYIADSDPQSVHSDLHNALASDFQEAMAEARAQALREAIALIEKWWPDANEEIRISGDACVTLAMRDVADELRKLAGGAT